ncbi:MAG: DUF4249 domain-containing protein, partial [Bacteroidota bacterium]
GFKGCVEPFEIRDTISFENALVIEATITNVFEEQTVRLTRTFAFEDDGPQPESNAQVTIQVDNGTQFQFTEGESGNYISNQPFQAEQGRVYTLNIRTEDGRNYASREVRLTTDTPLENVSAERMVIGDGTEGMAILVDAFDPDNSSNFYRYEYEETYQIIAPLWTTEDLIAPNGPNICFVEVVSAPDDSDRVCYASVISNDIILTNTSNLDEDRVSRFVVRFINRNNPIISHRYSILVRQFVHSNETFTFFDTLDRISDEGSLFSQVQPGFVVGNVFSLDNEEEMVLGYFDVATVSEERIFFNYEDFFPDEELPPYFVRCILEAPPFTNPLGGGCLLSPLVFRGDVQFFAFNDDSEEGEGPFIVVPAACGDCTVIGESEVPSFWIE